MYGAAGEERFTFTKVKVPHAPHWLNSNDVQPLHKFGPKLAENVPKMYWKCAEMCSEYADRDIQLHEGCILSPKGTKQKYQCSTVACGQQKQWCSIPARPAKALFGGAGRGGAPTLLLAEYIAQ